MTTLPAAYIAGQWHHNPDAPTRHAYFHAATGHAAGHQEAASTDQIEQAVAAARQALPVWRATPARERGAILARIAETITARGPALAQAQQTISGKPLTEALADVQDAAACFAYYASLCERDTLFEAHRLDINDDAMAAMTFHEPVGVAALIVPWNFPMVTTAWKLAPALAAGCSVIVKPSELTSTTEHQLVDCCVQGGLPAGVLNVVNGDGRVGAALIAHLGIDKISFTGSTETGRRIMAGAAGNMKRLTLELGGKSALVVAEDADPAQAVSIAMAGAYTNAGQMCSATARILVHRSVYERFITLMSAAVRSMIVAPPQVPTTQMGPLISAGHRDRVAGLLQQGLTQGARIVAQGALHPEVGDGFFMPPYLLETHNLNNPLWTDEIFGPVACVQPFANDDEAIALANATPYGLVSTVLTADNVRAQHYIKHVRAGLTWVNTPQQVYPEVCWGGLGASGIGRELGIPGLRSYQERRHAIAPRHFLAEPPAIA